jgi:general secretion pathway protein D
MPGSIRRGPATPRRGPLRAVAAAGLLTALLAALAGAGARAQPGVPPAAGPGGGDRTTVTPEGLVNLDFQDVEIATVIDTIARLTNRNFVYDDRVRGRVTIISPTPIPVEQAYTVFESVLQVKGFTTVDAPGGVVKVIPIRDAKETSIDTRATLGAPDTDRFVTRLIPLRYVDAEAISNVLKPLVSKEAALVAYPATNTVILTDSAANINRILQILEAIDVETHKEELAMIRVQYADAQTLAEQLSEVFGGEVSASTGVATQVGRIQPRVRRPPQTPQIEGGVGGGVQRAPVRIITDARTNALIILAARTTLEEMRALIRRLDVPVEGQGRIQVYYLKHAVAEDLADTLNSLLGAAPSAGGPAAAAAAAAGLQPQQLRAVSELSSAVSSLTADVATNSLVIQASPEGFETLRKVIEMLDIARPQVLVEALIMEVTVSDGTELGINWLLNLVAGSTEIGIAGITDTGAVDALASAADVAKGLAGGPGFIANVVATGSDDVIRAVIRASATDNSTNIISAPHILTSDNEEAEILVGDNIPIITNRVQSAGGIVTDPDQQSNLATSVNVERQDIGVTLRVTPQITEGDSLRLQIFQEITQINPALQRGVGDVNQVGPALSNRRIENVVVAQDGSTIVIGGLVSDDYSDNVSKIPGLGNIPVLGWLFKTTSTNLAKRNLLVFLTPHIIRTATDLEKASIGKREEFRKRSEQALRKAPEEREEVVVDEPVGILGEVGAMAGEGPAASAIQVLERRYPLERMREIERGQIRAREAARAAEAERGRGARYVVLAGSYADPNAARGTLLELVDAGFDGTLVSSGPAGQVRYELRLGPYTEVDQAERAAGTLQRAYGLPSRIVLEREGGP